MFDLFDLFRWLLGTVVTVYATVVTGQWAWSWWIWLTRPQAGYEKHFSMLRRYLVLHGLRIRIRSFWGDLLMIGLLSVAFVLLFIAHMRVYQLPTRAEMAAIRTLAAGDEMPGEGYPSHRASDSPGQRDDADE